MDPGEFLWSAERREELSPAVVARAHERARKGSEGECAADEGRSSSGLDTAVAPAQKQRDSVGGVDTLAAAANARRLIEEGDSWKPSWQALGVPARTFVLVLKSSALQDTSSTGDEATSSSSNGDGPSTDESTALGLRLRGRLSSSGAERCVEVAAVNPIAVAARAGLACGDVIIEVDGDMQIGRSTSQVEETLAIAWYGGKEVTVCVVPAMQARILTRPALSDEGDEVVCDDEDEEEQDPHEYTRRVVGVIRIPNLEERPAKKGGRPSSVLGRLFGSSDGGAGNGVGGGLDPLGLTAQTARAYILERSIRMLNEAGTESPGTPAIETWLRRVQPVLVKEFGEGLVEANSEFLLELLANYSTSTSSLVAASGDSAATAGGLSSPSASWAAAGGGGGGSGSGGGGGGGGGGGEGDGLDGVGRTAASPVRAFPTRENGIFRSSDSEAQDGENGDGDVGGSVAYVYVDQGYSDAQRQLEAQLNAAQAAWAAEKSRRRATEHLAPPPSLAPEKSLNMEMGFASFAKQKGKKSKSSRASAKSPSNDAKQAAKVHQAELERKARDTLAAAEEAWAAEKRRHAANIAAQQRHDGPPGLQHHRSAGGRVIQRHVEVGKPSEDPEPNRPWFGGASPPPESAASSASRGADDGSGLGGGDSF